MSGSPIMQDGKLVSAVTHVLVNDPTRGYGIFGNISDGGMAETLTEALCLCLFLVWCGMMEI